MIPIVENNTNNILQEPIDDDVEDDYLWHGSDLDLPIYTPNSNDYLWRSWPSKSTLIKAMVQSIIEYLKTTKAVA